MTAAATSMSRSHPPRWMGVALLASVALNLVVVGATATSLWRHSLGSEVAGSGPGSHNLLGYVGSLAPERRKQVWDRTQEQRGIVRPLRRELREAREETLKTLAAETFDADRYQAVQARLLAVDQKARAAIYKLYAEIAAGLTAEERQQFLAWRAKRRPMHNLLDEPGPQAPAR